MVKGNDGYKDQNRLLFPLPVKGTGFQNDLLTLTVLSNNHKFLK